MMYRFARCTLDTQTHELYCDGRLIPLQPRVFQVLTYLITQRHRLVPRHELLAQCWPQPGVHHSVVVRCIMAARQAIGDQQASVPSILTFRGQGYRFVLDVVEEPAAVVEPETVAGSAARSSAPLAEPTTASGTLSALLQAAEHKWGSVLYGLIASVPEGQEPVAASLWEALRQRVLTPAGPELRRYGGRVHAVTPWSFVVCFGVPLTHEDHAQRAVLAALALRRWTRRIAAEASEASMPSLPVRVGIHTGWITWGRGTDDAFTPVMASEVTALAQHLASTAPPDTVLVSDTTARRVRGLVRLTAFPPVDYPGGTHPPLAYHVLALRARRAEVRWGQQRPAARLVGRRRELTILHGLLEQALQGHGQVVNVVGEAGMGKSRLLQEFRRRCRRQLVTYLTGTCLSYGQTTPYLPLVEMLRTNCGIVEEDSLETLRAKIDRSLREVGMEPATWAPPLLHLVGLPSAATAEEPASVPTKARMFETLVQMAVCGGQRRPLIIAIEDMHWIDPTSEEFLCVLIDRIPSLPLLLLCTFRPGYQPAWMGKSYATQIALQPLTPPESRRILHPILPAGVETEGLTSALLAQADGNPLFLEELAREAAAVHREQRPWVMPETIQAVLAARLDRLPLADKQLLQMAAVLGVDVPRALLHAVSALSEELLDHSLTYLQMVECLYEIHTLGEPTYTFKHSLLRDVAYASLPASMRQHLHTRIAQVLLEHCPELVQTAPERLAQHYTAAGRGVEAAEAWQQAGQYAIERSAYTEALSHARQGLATLDLITESPLRHQHALRLHVTLGIAQMTMQGYGAPEVAYTYHQARALGHALDDAAWSLPALRGLHLSALVHADMPQARRLGADMLAVAQRLGEPRPLMYAYFTRGITLLFAGEPLSARQALEQSLHFYTMHSSEPPTIPYGGVHPGIAIVHHLALALWLLGYPTQALQRMQEAHTYTAGLHNALSQTMTAVFTAVVHQLRREAQAAQQHAELALELAARHGFPFWATLSQLLYSGAQSLSGQEPARRAEIPQELTSAHAAEVDGVSRPLLLAPFIEAYHQAEHIEAGFTLLRETLAAGATTGVRYYEAELQRLEGELCWRHPHPDTQAQAEHCWVRALETARAQGAKSLELRATLSLSRLWQRQGRRAPARDLLAACYHWFTEGWDTADLREARTLLETLA